MIILQQIKIRWLHASSRRIVLFRMYRVIITSFFLVTVLTSCSQDSAKSIEKGESSLRLGDYTMAIKFFEDVLNNDPENFRARLGMGKALIQKASAQNGDSLIWSNALIHIEAARTLNPQSDIEPLLSDTWMVHARKKLQIHDTIGALNALSRTIDYNPKSIEALNLAGIIYYRIGDPGKAAILFERALAIDSLKSFTHFNIGMLCWSQNDFACAHKAWFKALTLAPEDKDIIYWYSVAEKKSQETAK
jgi:tetratricopeptide (TPR) repeat protein